MEGFKRDLENGIITDTVETRLARCGQQIATPVVTRRSTRLRLAIVQRLAVAQGKYHSWFQLTHMPRGNHVLSIASNGDQREDTKL